MFKNRSQIKICKMQKKNFKFERTKQKYNFILLPSSIYSLFVVQSKFKSTNSRSSSRSRMVEALMRCLPSAVNNTVTGSNATRPTNLQESVYSFAGGLCYDCFTSS